MSNDTSANAFDAYLDRMTGGSDAITRQYLNSLLIEMRLVNSGLASTQAEAFGHTLDTPIMLGAFGGYPMLGENALLQEAQAAAEANTVLWLGGFEPAEDVARCIAQGAKTVKVIKPYQDSARFLGEAQQAEALGCVAVATDLDHAYSKKTGGYDCDPKEGALFGPKSEEELAEAVDRLRVPLVVKGVLSVSDAVNCQKAGVRYILLSHHHSIMDYAVPPVLLLSEIRQAVGRDMTIIVDCGIDTGAEAFKALALGADLVCSARAVMKALRKGGRDGVVDWVRQNTALLRTYLNRTGSPDISHIDPTVIHRRAF